MLHFTSIFWELAISKEIRYWKYSNIVINISPPIYLTLPTEVYPAINVRKSFVTTKFWQIFDLSHPVVMGGRAETMYKQINFIFSKE